jgi:hypothetical protein
MQVGGICSEADARLIAAAPDGYAFAKKFIAYALGFSGGMDELEDEEREVLTEALSFVARVEGRTNPEATSPSGGATCASAKANSGTNT